MVGEFCQLLLEPFIQREMWSFGTKFRFMNINSPGLGSDTQNCARTIWGKLMKYGPDWTRDPGEKGWELRAILPRKKNKSIEIKG